MTNNKAIIITGVLFFICLSGLAQPKTRQLPKNSLSKAGKITNQSVHINSIPVITPKNNLTFTLNANGEIIIQLDDIATVTGNTEVSMDRNTFNCSTLGDQVIKVTAKGTPGDPTNARFYLPWGMASDAAGNLFIADVANYRIREISVTGEVTTFAGTGTLGSVDGPNAQAMFAGPEQLAVAPNGTVYVTDEGIGDIRKISNGNVTTIITHHFVSGLAVDKNNNLYATQNSKIVKIADDGTITDFVGSDLSHYADGNGAAAGFGQPYGLTFAKDGNLYVADIGTYTIRKVTPAGDVSTIVKDFPFLSYVPFTNGNPDDNYAQLILDSQGNIFVANGYVIWKVKPDGTYSLFAGTTPGFKDGQGTTAEFSGTWGITIDKDDNLYVTDWKYSFDGDDGNNAIRKITPGGMVTTIAGGVKGFSNGNVGSNTEVVKPIHVNIVTKPIFDPMPDLVLEPGANCKAALPDYIPKAKVSDPCNNVQLKITQSPAAGTLLDVGATVSVILQVNDGFGGQGSTGFQVKVVTSTVPVLKIQSDHSEVCAGAPVIFTAIPVNEGSAPQYNWQLNGNSTGFNGITYTNSNLKSDDVITCVLTNNDQCVSTHTAVSNPLSIAVSPLVTPRVTVKSSVNGAVCAGTLITFTAISVNQPESPRYQWQVNNVNEGNNSSSFSSSTLNDGDVVTCMLSGNQNCTIAVVSPPIFVHINPLPVIRFDGSVSVTKGSGVQLSPFVIGDIKSYAWEPSSGLSNPYIANPVAKPTKTTTYHLQVTTVAGCIAAEQVTVIVVQNASIPNTFTPNGDGINDKWEISFLNDYLNCTVNIYTRYGQNIYQSKGYAKPWDGTYLHKAVPTGTYYYIIDLKNGESALSGFITVIR